jgi:hypothetical protein
VPIPGDYNADGIVDAADYQAWTNAFGTVVMAGTGADGSGDGVVDAADYTTWRDHLGQMAGSGSAGASRSRAAVPEPTSILTVVSGAVLFSVRWNRRRGRPRREFNGAVTWAPGF